MAANFAATLRRRLFRQHLGLIPPQDCPGPIDAAMHSVGIPFEYDFGSIEDNVVKASLLIAEYVKQAFVLTFPLQDPLSDDLHRLWNETAQTNAAVYAELFHCVPAQGVKNWDDYKAWVPSAKAVGHIAHQDKLELSYIKHQLAKIKGHITAMPTGQLGSTSFL